MSGSADNPLIGQLTADTMSNCQQVLSIIQLATESTDLPNGPNEVMGYHLILNCLRHALRYEHDHFSERNPGQLREVAS